jgi:hypothetical protein
MFYLAQFVKPLATPSLRRMFTRAFRTGGPGSIPGAVNLESGFHPFGVGKMSNSKYVMNF